MSSSSNGHLVSWVALATLACGSGTAEVAEHGGAHHGAGAPHHFSDPETFAASWKDPKRDTWQKPDEIVAALGVKAGDTVVDLGAGTGYLVPPLSRAVGATGEVIAADIEPAMLRFLDASAKTEGWTNVRTHASRTDSLALPTASVDHVVALNVWHHVEQREAYARDLLGMMKPGGAFVVVDFLNEPTEGEGPPLEMRLAAEQVVAELAAGGFEAAVVPETMPRHYVVRGVRPGPAAP
ncbi:MAG: methyltransferase domain-containing protein [Myxococcota bacterium]